jgi:ribokinase
MDLQSRRSREAGTVTSSPKFDVIVCGSLHLDIVVRAPALPRIDETAVGTSWQQVCGGKGGNQAVQAQSHGARTAMIGCVGDDAFGQTLRAHLEKSNVDQSAVSTHTTLGSGMSVAVLQDDGDYGAVIVSGSNTAITADQIAQHWQALGGAKILVLQNEIPHAANVAAAKCARAVGATVVFNAAPTRPLSDDLLDAVNVLIVNRVEAEMLAGQPVYDFKTAQSAMPKLLGTHRSVIITLGGEGLVLGQSNGETTTIDAIPVKVTSTHGAGDCFVGALAAELATGKILPEACHTANQRAAAFVSRT